jgi:hypothetical protein
MAATPMTTVNSTGHTVIRHSELELTDRLVDTRFMQALYIQCTPCANAQPFVLRHGYFAMIFFTAKCRKCSFARCDVIANASEYCEQPCWNSWHYTLAARKLGEDLHVVSAPSTLYCLEL